MARGVHHTVTGSAVLGECEAYDGTCDGGILYRQLAGFTVHSTWPCPSGSSGTCHVTHTRLTITLAAFPRGSVRIIINLYLSLLNHPLPWSRPRKEVPVPRCCAGFCSHTSVTLYHPPACTWTPPMDLGRFEISKGPSNRGGLWTLDFSFCVRRLLKPYSTS